MGVNSNMPFKNLEETIKDNVYMEMCRYCHKAKVCHDNCENCSDYEEQVKRELNRLRK